MSIDEGDLWNTLQKNREEHDRLKNAIEWLLSGDTGLSSKSILARALGFAVERYPPADAGDRGRCIRMLIRLPWAMRGLLLLESEDLEWANQGKLIREKLHSGIIR